MPYGFLSRACFYCPNLIAVAPVARNKEISQSHVIIMTLVPLEVEYSVDPLYLVYLLSKFDVSCFSMTGDIDFQTAHSAAFKQFKIDSHLVEFGQVKNLSFYSVQQNQIG